MNYFNVIIYYAAMQFGVKQVSYGIKTIWKFLNVKHFTYVVSAYKNGQ